MVKMEQVFQYDLVSWRGYIPLLCRLDMSGWRTASSSIGGCKAPCDSRNSQPSSPPWAHFDMAPCLVSLLGGHHPPLPRCHIISSPIKWRISMAPMMNSFNGSYPVPLSPANVSLQGKRVYFANDRNTGGQQPSSDNKASDGSSYATPEPSSLKDVLSPR